MPLSHGTSMKNTKRSQETLVQHLTPPPGIRMPRYPAHLDRVYRGAMAGFTGFLGVTAVGTGFSSPMIMDLGHWGAAASLLVAGWTFLVWLSSWRWFVRGLVLTGFLLAGWPALALVSWGLLLGASAIMAAKETHCFHFKAGKIIPWYTLFLGGLLLFTAPPAIEGGFAWLGLTGLWTWLVLGRLQLPLFVID